MHLVITSADDYSREACSIFYSGYVLVKEDPTEFVNKIVQEEYLELSDYNPYNSSTMKKLLKDAGFTVIDIETKSYHIIEG